MKSRAVLTFLSLFAVVSIGSSAASAGNARRGNIRLVVHHTESAVRNSGGRSLEGKVATVQVSGAGYDITMADGQVLHVAANAAVHFRGERYSVTDLEAGDHIRVMTNGRGLPLRQIVVLQSASEPSQRVEEATADNRLDDSNRTWGVVESVNSRNDTFLMTTRDGREIRVDAYRSSGPELESLQQGDAVSVSGVFDGSVLRAEQIEPAGRGEGMNRDDRQDGRRNDRLSRDEKRNSDESDDDEDEDEDD